MKQQMLYWIISLKQNLLKIFPMDSGWIHINWLIVMFHGLMIILKVLKDLKEKRKI